MTDQTRRSPSLRARDTERRFTSGFLLLARRARRAGEQMVTAFDRLAQINKYRLDTLGGNSDRKDQDMAEPNSGPCKHRLCLDGQETGGTVNPDCWLCGGDGVIYFCPTHNPDGTLPLTPYDEDGCDFCKDTGSSPVQAGGFGDGGGSI